jgi:single-strand DNA-binding protein
MPAPARDEVETVNTVHLVGRVSSGPQARALPSGDVVVTFRVVVPRPRRPRSEAARAAVDAIDIACWTARTRGTAGGLAEGEHVEIEGSLRRRFFAGAAGRVSRYEVEARRLRRKRAR